MVARRLLVSLNRDAGELQSRARIYAELTGCVTFDSHSVHVASLPLVVIKRVVLDDPVIPHGHSANFPPNSTCKSLLFTVAVKKSKERFAFGWGHSLDAFGERPIDV